MSPAPKSCPQEQEEKILAAAVACIEETSMLDFTMSQVAKRAGVSMGSVYKHIHSKEDVLLALAVRNAECLSQTFSKILSAPLTGTEQLIAISLLDFGKVEPYSFSRHLEMLVSNEALLRRASSNWRECLQSRCSGVENLFQQRFQQLIDEGELMPEGDTTRYIEELYLGVWAINVGYIQVVLQLHADNESEELPFPLAGDNAHVANCRRLINSYGWRQPLDQQGISRAIGALEKLGFR